MIGQVVRSEDVRPGDLIVKGDTFRPALAGRKVLVIAISSRVDDYYPASSETVYEFTVLTPEGITKIVRFEHERVTCIKGT